MLTRPILKSDYGLLKAFDSKKDYNFKFIVIGGDQVVRNRLQIAINDSDTIVYDKTIDSFELEHNLSGNTLTNGVRYKAKVMTYSKHNESSLWSDDVVFKCLSNPVVGISNIVNGVIGNQTYLFEGTYSQAENAKLESYKFYLYDDRQNLIGDSGEILNKKISNDNILFEFAGFENNKSYYIGLKTLSSDGLEGKSDLIEFKVFYIQPKIQNVLKLENVADSGSIRVTAKINRVLGQIGTEPIFYENNDYINLKHGSIYFDKENGFSIEKDFTLQIWGKDLTDNKSFIPIYFKDGVIKLVRRQNRIYLIKEINGVNWYQLYTEELEGLDSSSNVYIWIRQRECLFDLYAKII